MERIKDYTSVILKIFLRDLKRVLRNPVSLIIILGVCLLPALYAWYIIAANWNPYDNTDGVKVAIASEDRGADSSYSGPINVGDEIIDELRDNHELDWQFVDAGQAVDGVYSGEYYAALVFPADFSEAFISAFSGHLEKPRIDYYVNEKISGTATKVTDSGASSVQTRINETFVGTVSSKLAELARGFAVEVEDHDQAAEGTLVSGIAQADEAVRLNEKLVEELAPVISSSRTSIEEAKDLLGRFDSDLDAMEGNLASTQTTLGEIRDTLSKYSAEIAGNATSAAFAIARAASAAQVQAASLASDIERARGAVQSANDEARRIIAENDRLLEGLRASQAAGIAGIDAIISSLEAQNDALASTVSSLDALANDLAASAGATTQATESIAGQAQEASSSLRQGVTDLQTRVIPQIDASLDSISAALGTLRGVLVSLAPVISQTTVILDQLLAALDQASLASDAALGSLESTEGDLSSTLTDLRALQSSTSVRIITELTGKSPTDIADFMAAPVKLDTTVLYPVSPYGSGIAPFFSNLAFWVCGFILLAIVRMRVSPAGVPRFTRTQAYFGRWLLCIVIGLVQGLIICVGDLALGVQCASPVAFVGTGLLAVTVYINLLFALAYSMRHIGKAIGVIILVLQIPGSSGLFPVETMPAFYQAINPFLPFSYSIAAMREAIGGFYGLHYLSDMLMLALVFFPLGIAIGFVGIRFGFNANQVFDEHLSKTDLFVSETPAGGKGVFRLRPMARALLHSGEYRDKIIANARRFEARYPKLVRAGWVGIAVLVAAMVAIPVVFQLLPHGQSPTADANLRLIALACFFIALVLVNAYLVLINYLYAKISYQLSIADSDGGIVPESPTTQGPGRYSAHGGDGDA